jgi:hypothetical protein
MLYKLEHLFNSGLMFLFLVSTAGTFPPHQYGVFAAALAYYYLYLLLLNSTVLEPMQLIIARKYAKNYMGYIFSVGVKISVITWMFVVLIALIIVKFTKIADWDYILILEILVASFFNAQTQITRRVLLAQKCKGMLICFALWNSITLSISIGLMKFDEFTILHGFLYWQLLTGAACLIWLLYQVHINPCQTKVVKPIRSIFLRYSSRNLPLTPFNWIFGNFPFIFGPALFQTEALADYRKTINFTGPMLQYYSIIGIIFLSESAKLNNVNAGFSYIYATARKRLIAISIFAMLFIIVWPLIISIDSDMWRYLPSKRDMPFLFLASFFYVYVESINYLVGSNYRANNLTFPLVIISVVPCILLTFYVLINKPSSPAELVLVSAVASSCVLIVSYFIARVKK